MASVLVRAGVAVLQQVTSAATAYPVFLITGGPFHQMYLRASMSVTGAFVLGTATAPLYTTAAKNDLWPSMLYGWPSLDAAKQALNAFVLPADCVCDVVPPDRSSLPYATEAMPADLTH